MILNNYQANILDLHKILLISLIRLSKANDASNMAENWYVRYMRTNVRKKDGCCWKNFCIRERDIIRSN